MPKQQELKVVVSRRVSCKKDRFPSHCSMLIGHFTNAVQGSERSFAFARLDKHSRDIHRIKQDKRTLTLSAKGHELSTPSKSRTCCSTIPPLSRWPDSTSVGTSRRNWGAILFSGDHEDYIPTPGRFFTAVSEAYQTITTKLRIPNATVLYTHEEDIRSFPVTGVGSKSELSKAIGEADYDVLFLFLTSHGVKSPGGTPLGLRCTYDLNAPPEDQKFIPVKFHNKNGCNHIQRAKDIKRPESVRFKKDLMTPLDLEQMLLSCRSRHIHIIVHTCFAGVFCPTSTLSYSHSVKTFTSATDPIQELPPCGTLDRWSSPFIWTYHIAQNGANMNVNDLITEAYCQLRNCNEDINPMLCLRDKHGAWSCSPQNT